MSSRAKMAGVTRNGLTILLLSVSCLSYGSAQESRAVAEAALKELRRGAEQGNASAQFWLGELYAEGRGVAQDYAEAVRWYRRAADQGEARAQLNLGVMYAKGQGVRQDFTEAARWFLKAAQQGETRAQYMVGFSYDRGKDYAEAVRWYRKAAEQGETAAQHKLGLMYARGQGVSQDTTEAVRWWCRAAEQGDAAAQHAVGVLFDGAVRASVEAHMWMSLAASRATGDEQKRYADARDLIAGKMTPAQFAAAQRLALEWKPKSDLEAKAECSGR